MTDEAGTFGGATAAGPPAGYGSATANYTPSIRVYCAEADVDYVWSSFGVQTRTDDDESGVVNEANLMMAIEKAALEMNNALMPLYAVSVIAQSPWAKWCNAVLAAVDIGLRRGNAVPDPLLKEADKYTERLKQIGKGESPLMLTQGPAAMAQDHSPLTTNYTVDTRFPRTKIRRIPSTSAQNVPAGGLKQFNALDFYTLP